MEGVTKIIGYAATYIATHGTRNVAAFQSLSGIVPSGQHNTQKSNIYNVGGVSKGVPTNIPLHVLMKIGTFLGSELFYSIAWPLGLIMFDCMITRRLMTVWMILYYIGQALKDLLRLPRPLSPPALKLEHLDEYGMPSTHAMGAAGLSIYLAIMLPEISNYQHSTWFTVSIAVVWTLIVCISRVYMGSHTFEDIIGGLIITGLIVLGFRPYENVLDSYYMKTDYMPAILLLISAFLLYIYPKAKNESWSESFGDTAIVTGVWTGVLSSFWYRARYGIHPDYGWLVEEVSVAPQNFWIQVQNVERMMVIVLYGLLMVPALLFTKIMVKFISVKILKALFNEPKTEKTYKVEGLAKLITYTTIGASQGFAAQYCSVLVSQWVRSSSYF